jgi:hypothetical protein
MTSDRCTRVTHNAPHCHRSLHRPRHQPPPLPPPSTSSGTMPRLASTEWLSAHRMAERRASVRRVVALCVCDKGGRAGMPGLRLSAKREGGTQLNSARQEPRTPRGQRKQLNQQHSRLSVPSASSVVNKNRTSTPPGGSHRRLAEANTPR